jgi:hypothetical protein
MWKNQHSFLWEKNISQIKNEINQFLSLQNGGLANW